MKKAINVFALFAVLLVAVSARTERLFQATKGHHAPELTLEATDSTAVELADFKGEYVLLNFWASTDAESRLAAKAYDKATDTLKNSNLRHVAVNVDHSERLFREIIRRDGLAAKEQYRADAASSQLIDKWHINNGLRSFLINPQGQIIAVDPSVETLNSTLAG